jgi:two-component system chemotaxis response regulator CheB
MESFVKPSLIVIGCSAGGIEALRMILTGLDRHNMVPIVICQHRATDSAPLLVSYFAEVCQLPVKEAESKEPIEKGSIYFAPAGYHLLISDDMSFDLSVEEPVNFSRPSIDVLFESAADALGPRVTGIILTGANEDGAYGLRRILEEGGWALVQDPLTAVFAEMPQAALTLSPSAEKKTLQEIAGFLLEISKSR